jgi:hypothetical protein
MATPSVSARESPGILDKSVQLSLGSFSLYTDTRARLDGDVGAGTDVDWEDTFGGGDTLRFRVDGQWRFADRST